MRVSAVAVVAWLACELVAAAYGLRFDATSLPGHWHLLDEEILRGDLLRGVFYLHSQPPIFNLLVGAGLKLFPDAYRMAFAVTWSAMTLALLLAVARLLALLAVPPALAAVACITLAVAPPFVVYSHWLHYTLPAALLLSLSAVALGEFLRTGSRRWAHAFAWIAAALMLTRPLYHPVWFVAALGAVLMTVAPTARRPLVAAAVLPFLLVNVWYAKNYVQVGSYAASSWFGMHFRRGWVPTDEQTARITAAGAPVVWSRLPFLPAPYYEDLGYFAATGTPVHPAIDAPFKRNGEPNYNHRDYARLSRDMFVGDLHAIALYPGFFARRVAAALTIFLQLGPRPMPNKPDNPAIARLAAVSNGLLLRGASDRPNLFYLLFFAPLLFAGLRVVRGARDAPMRPLLAYMTVTMLWTAASIVLVEIGENDRMRFDIDPFVFVLLACTIAWLVRDHEPDGGQSRRRRTVNRPSALA